MKRSEFRAIHNVIQKCVTDSPYANNTFYVGECVRDLVLGKDINSIEICVTGTEKGGSKLANLIAEKLGIKEENANPRVMEKFDIAVLRLRSALPKLGDIPIKIVQSKDRPYITNGTSNAVGLGTMYEDACTRDLSINAMYWSVTNKRLCDISGNGRKDLNAHIIRTAALPQKAFATDASFIFSVIRYSADYGWGIEKETWIEICKNIHRLQNIGTARKLSELRKILLCKNPSVAIRKLYLCGALDIILPSVAKLNGFTQGKKYDLDAFEHTLSILDKTKPIFENRMAALLCNIGKIPTKSVDVFGDVKFNRYAEESAHIAEYILKALGNADESTEKIVTAIRLHNRFMLTSNPSNRTITKFIAQAKQENVELCFDLIEAFNMSFKERYRIVGQVERIRNRIALHKAKEAKKIKLPINGKEIMKAFNLRKGPLVGSILDIIRERCSISPKMTKAEAMEIAKEAVESKKI